MCVGLCALGFGCTAEARPRDKQRLAGARPIRQLRLPRVSHIRQPTPLSHKRSSATCLLAGWLATHYVSQREGIQATDPLASQQTGRRRRVVSEVKDGKREGESVAFLPPPPNCMHHASQVHKTKQLLERNSRWH